MRAVCTSVERLGVRSRSQGLADLENPPSGDKFRSHLSSLVWLTAFFTCFFVFFFVLVFSWVIRHRVKARSPVD